MEAKRFITKIVVDLSSWTDHYPTGCILYDCGTEVDSQYCDNADEFIEFIDTYKNSLIPHVTEVRVVFDSYDLDNESARECAEEVINHINSLMYGN